MPSSYVYLLHLLSFLHIFIILIDLAQTAPSVVSQSTSPNGDEASERSKSETESSLHTGGAAQCQVACQGKEPRRIVLTSLSAKMEHSGTLKEADIKDSISNEGDKQNIAHVRESLKNVDKPKTNSISLEVQEVTCAVPQHKPNRRVEVITLPDDKPSTTESPRICTSGYQLFPASSTPDAAVKTAAKSVAADSSKPSAISNKETSSELDSPHPVALQKSILGAALVTAKNSGITQSNDSSNHSKVANLQARTNDVTLEEQSKGGTSPPVKAPKRVGFVTLTAEKAKQNKS